MSGPLNASATVSSGSSDVSRQAQSGPLSARIFDVVLELDEPTIALRRDR